MKILLIFTLFLISDAQKMERITVSPGETATFSCTYQGGSTKFPKFFCKWDYHSCTEVVRTSDSPRGRFSITEDSRRSSVTVRISDVKKEDRGVYSCRGWGDSGTEREDLITVNRFHLHVTDAQEVEKITVSPGDTATFSCTYQGESIHHPKFFCKWDGEHCTEVIRTSDSPRGRFSITEDSRRSSVTSRISDVKKEDGGVYDCRGWKDPGMTSEDVIITNRFHLHVTGRKTPPVIPTTTKIPSAETSAPTTSEEPHSRLSVVFIIITVCVTLLLIGGFSTFFYVLGRNRALSTVPNTNQSDLFYQTLNSKTNQSDSPSSGSLENSIYSSDLFSLSSDSASTSQQRGTNNTADYENDPPRNRNINMGPFYHNLNPNINQSDHVYQSLNPNTNQSDHVYQSLNPNTNQSDHVYQSLNPITNQSDSGYQTLNPTGTNHVMSTRL